MGEKFGTYNLVRKVAQGGMAEVFLAERQAELGNFSQQVAIKRIYPHLAKDPELATMFFDEARIASRLHHPNVVQIFDLGQINDYFYIAMEFVHGHDLRSLCEQSLDKNDFVPIHLAARIVADIAAGMHYAHSRVDEHGQPMHIVHRDISPQNILVGLNGNVKLCDFGIAKAEERLTSTRAGQFKGKFSYMSPEQVAAGSEGLDARSDIFALGTVLYEITAITRLFRGKSDFETIRMVTEQPISPPRSLRPNYPPELERIVLKALSRDVNQRYQSAEQLQLDLEAWLVQERALATSAHLSQYMRRLFPEQASSELSSALPLLAPSLKVKPLTKFSPPAAPQAPPTDPLIDAQLNEETRPAQPALKLNLNLSLPKPATTLASPAQPAPDLSASTPTDPIVATPQRSSLSDESSSAELRQEAMTDEEYDLLDATADIKVEHLRDVIAQNPAPAHYFSEQESSYPEHAAHTPLPRPRNMTPMGHHDVARATIGQQLQAPAPSHAPRATQVSGQHPSVVRPPQVSGQHSTILRTTGPHPTMGQAQAHRPAPQLLEPTFDMDRGEPDASNMSVELNFAAIQKRDRLKRALIGIGVLSLMAATIFFFLKYGTEREIPPPENAKPEFTEEQLKLKPLPQLNRTSVSINSAPEGALILVNGISTGQKTPASVELVTDETNSVSLFLEGHAPAHRRFSPKDAPTDPLALTPSPKPGATPTSIIVNSSPEGATILHNGNNLGVGPTTLEALPMGSEQHFVFEREGYWPSSALFEPTPEIANTLIASIDSVELQSKKDEADLIVDVLPRGAQIYINGELEGISPLRKTMRRNQLLHIEVKHRDYEPLMRDLELGQLGALSWRAFMTKIKQEKGKLSLKPPQGAKQVFIGSSSYTDDALKSVELKAGEHEVVIVMQEGGRLEGKLTVEPNAMTNYRATINNGKLVFSR